jgi:hypothetical protein
VRVVKGVKDLGANRGATGSHIIQCDDGKTYVVKFAGQTKVAVNEFVGQALAAAVGLPVPGASLVEVSSELVASSSDMRYRAIAPGLHQGSEMVPDSLDLDGWRDRSSSEGTKLVNDWALPAAICHDNWILTVDRDRSDNHLVQFLDGGFRYLLLDFTHGFTGPSWTADSLEQASYLRRLVPVHPVMAGAVTGPASIRPTLERIEALGDPQIEAIVGDVPPSWGLTEEEGECLVNFLKLRRGLLRSVLAANKRSFPNWVD